MFRIILINALVFLGIFSIVETWYRATYFFDTCWDKTCNYEAFHVKNFTARRNIGISQPDPVLGHKPNPGAYVLEGWKWRDSIVTIKEDTSRSNGNNDVIETKTRVLAVGDSFTYGAQVSDAGTWPSALERRLRSKVVNGGVGGYGFGQAFLRAGAFMETQSFDLLIVSVMLPSDTSRDRYMMRNSRPKPAWIEENGEIVISGPDRHGELIEAALKQQVHLPDFTGYSYFLAEINRSMFKYRGVYNIVHPKAASAGDIACRIVRDLSDLELPKVILLQYTPPHIDGDRPAIAGRLENCARNRGIPVIDSYPTLKAIENFRDLYFGHLTPQGNEVIAELLDGELRRMFPKLF